MRTLAHAVVGGVALLIASAASAKAAVFACALTDQSCTTDCGVLQLQFDIDDSQFAPPLSSNEPPRRQVTRVELDGAVFSAEAIRMAGGIYGFHEDEGALGSRLMIVQADGTGTLFLSPANKTYAGQCTRG